MCLRAGMLSILMVFLVVTMVQSQPSFDDKRKERSKYETELEQLKRKDTKGYEELKVGAILWTQLLLGRLGYGLGPYNGVLDEKTKNALREYQKQQKLPVTGDPLSFETFEQIRKDMELMDYQPMSLPSLQVFVDLWDQGKASAKGTWVLANEKMAWSEQVSDIQCFRDRRICIDATAIVTGKGGDRRLTVDTDVYEIERWDDYEIVTKPVETGAGCVRYIRKFNRVQKSVTGLRSTISTGGLCKGIETKEMHMILSDGFKVYRDLYQRSMETRNRLMRVSSEARKSQEQRPSK